MSFIHKLNIGESFSLTNNFIVLGTMLINDNQLLVTTKEIIDDLVTLTITSTTDINTKLVPDRVTVNGSEVQFTTLGDGSIQLRLPKVADIYIYKTGSVTYHGSYSYSENNTGLISVELVPYYTFSGIVTLDGEPVNGAKVVLGTTEKLTSSTGAFEFTELLANTYTFSLLLNGTDEDVSESVVISTASVVKNYELHTWVENNEFSIHCAEDHSSTCFNLYLKNSDGTTRECSYSREEGTTYYFDLSNVSGEFDIYLRWSSSHSPYPDIHEMQVVLFGEDLGSRSFPQSQSEEYPGNIASYSLVAHVIANNGRVRYTIYPADSTCPKIV